ncbi:Ribosomal RNA large subunit methyltransferase H [Desulfotomaculum nigrificans CO-1-SRB]|uniref:Ribosomal RNA large subunit methyltransferase H n=1 Tax=Desulfotomaculum nigrificans (strain DSM 14880 / VKM B-2319 / CO-1-SRB) TaxID=868595 RepID=F6B6A6_DESCC|nr:23S rRNA (pseudouridine(1915)-N(3))-methyltransferase RlmH [Desulfotomaculum nigrificans]AEF95529.1 Ribosomal RNA large subunit methyltransferase H [Desulfotomaculum nigrificans CO-1-SRB]
MKITILAVGRLKEKYLVEGVKEYLKRLNPYARVEISEVPDEPCPENAPPAIEEQVKQKEADRLIKRLRPGTFLIVLDARGKMFTSEELAGKIEELALTGRSDITFIIGGSVGLATSIVDRADLLLSLSKLTFPHQIVRLVLLEQVYRCFRIIKNEPYHK